MNYKVAEVAMKLDGYEIFEKIPPDIPGVCRYCHKNHSLVVMRTKRTSSVRWYIYVCHVCKSNVQNDWYAVWSEVE